MTVKVVQKCDVCGEERLIKSPGGEEFNNGWRELRPGKHICPDCIDRILNN